MNKRKIVGILAVCLVIAGVFAVFAAEPGTEGDPVVTLSYITEKVIPDMYAYIDSKISGNSSDDAPSGVASDANSFSVVEVPAGREVICDAGCEIILRSGAAKVIATAKGGLADTTAGYDLANGSQAPSNHLMIVPVDDGRGVYADTDCILMIKGNYSVK